MPHPVLFAIAGLCTAALPAVLPVYAARADDVPVIVTVTGVQGLPGEVACRLFHGPRSFPFGKATAGEARTARRTDGPACTFSNLAPGSYAIAVALLPKDQDRVTRDLLGRPRQPWGVSNNIRHALRAPRYDEAAFTVERGKPTRLLITLAK